jgi:hypothetical protein
VSKEHHKTTWFRAIEQVKILLIRRLGFWSNGMHDLNLDSKGLVAGEAISRKLILILGRQHYHETVKDYPIENINDLKRALRNEPLLAPYDGIRLTKIDKLFDRTHRVTIWVIKHTVLSSLKHRPWFLIPESAAITAVKTAQPIIAQRFGKRLFAVNSVSGIVSTELDHQKDSDTNWRLPFEVGSGIDQISSLDEHQTYRCFISGVKRLLTSVPATFFLPIEFGELNSYPWAAAGKLSALILSTYLLLVSAGLGVYSWRLDQQLLVAKEETKSALEIRREIKNKNFFIEEHNSIRTNTQPLWLVWDLLLDLRKDKVVIRNVDNQKGALVIRGHATRASDILQQLSDDPRVLSADYLSPIKKSPEGERFAINITLNHLVFKPE